MFFRTFIKLGEILSTSLTTFFAILTTRHKSQNRTDAKNVKRQNVERHFVENTI